MRIGILTKKTDEESFIGKLVKSLQSKGHVIELRDESSISIDTSLMHNDFYVLKSKGLIFLYAAFYLINNKIPVFPDPYLTFKHKDRIEAYYLIKNIHLKTPKFYVGTPSVLKVKLSDKDFPLVLKSMMGSGSKGIIMITKRAALDSLPSEKIFYFQEYISGSHYLVYFIEDELSVLNKPPFSNEHVSMEAVSLEKDVIDVVNKWKREYELPYGHLDMVREENSENLYIVDVGCFPDFTNWKGKGNAVDMISAIISEKIEKAKSPK